MLLARHSCSQCVSRHLAVSGGRKCLMTIETHTLMNSMMPISFAQVIKPVRPPPLEENKQAVEGLSITAHTLFLNSWCNDNSSCIYHRPGRYSGGGVCIFRSKFWTPSSVVVKPHPLGTDQLDLRHELRLNSFQGGGSLCLASFPVEVATPILM